MRHRCRRPTTHPPLDHLDQVIALTLVITTQNILWWIPEVYRRLELDTQTVWRVLRGRVTLHQGTRALQEVTRLHSQVYFKDHSKRFLG